jgi:heat shock protein HslJ
MPLFLVYSQNQNFNSNFMKALQNTLAFFLLFAGLISCNSSGNKNNRTNNSNIENSRDSIDWEGIYQGIIPCADCKGIKTQITLNKDLTYLIETKYLGKEDTIIKISGNFFWDENGGIITLDNSNKQNYLVSKNLLFHLDKNKNNISGNLSEKYILRKEKVELTDKYWKLIMLNNIPVHSRMQEPYIMFYKDENRFSGNASCNNFVGKYEANQDQIKFNKPILTKMGCTKMDIEIVFLNFLEVTSNFSLTENELVLKDSVGIHLATFQSIYFD